MFPWFRLSGSERHHLDIVRVSTCERSDRWDGSSSQLGLADGAAATPAETAAPAQETSRTPATPATDKGAKGAEADGAGTHGDPDEPDGDEDENEPDDPDADPLDLLTSGDDEPAGDGQPRPIEDRYKALSKRSRKLERQLKKALPVQHALREAGVDVRTLLESHRTLAGIQAAAQRNPKLRELLFSDDPAPSRDPEPRNRDRRGREDDDEPTDYPFDVNDPAGRFLADLDRRARTGQRDVMSRLERIEQSLGQRVGRIEEHTTQTTRASIAREWKGVADTAASKLEGGVREMFLDAMHSAQQAYLRGEHRKSPQEIADHYLRKLKVPQGQRDRASAAARQRTAETNTRLQRRPNGGSPASPQSRAVPRMADFNRQLQTRFGG